MKYVISRYNHDTAWIADYTNDYILYDRSDKPIDGAIIVPNIGSDIYDKLSFIIDNYDNLPDVAVYTKCNLFKYITKEEWDKICNNTTFTPILTQNHKEKEGICYYHNGIYYEINNGWFTGAHPIKSGRDGIDLMKLLGIWRMPYVPFAPGSNYILPKENILQHPKEFYEKLRSYLEWDRYPGEAMIMERGLYTLWQ